jgi:aminotransferase
MPHPARYAAEINESMSVKFSNAVYATQDRGGDLIVLSSGEANFDIPLFRFDDLPIPQLYKYSYTRGLPQFRALLSDHYQRRFGVTIDPESEMIITAGSKLAIHITFMAILEPGDEVLIHEPAWASYPEQVRLCHGRPVRIPYDATLADYGRYVTERTRAIVVNNPNNPTGRVVTRREWQALHQFASEHDLYIVSDEGYSDYVPRPDDFISAAIDDPGKTHTIVCNTLSKNYGMSGWRIGYVFTNADLLFNIMKINQHLITCPATILQLYMARHFHEVLAITAPQIRDVVSKRNDVARILHDRGFRVLPGDGTFYLFVSIEDSELRSEEFCRRLLVERGISTVPGVAYGQSCDRFIRITAGSESLDRICIGIDRIAQLVRETAVPNSRLAYQS